MAKFSSEEIRLLQQGASRTPQVQQVTGNLVADVANLAATGLGLYKQQQDKKALASAKDQQAAYDRELSKAVNAYNKLKGELLANEGIAPTTVEKRLTDFLATYSDPEFQREVSSISRKESGFGRMDAIKAAQGFQAQRRTEQRIQEDRELAEREREQEAAEAEEARQIQLVEAGVKSGVDVSNVANWTEEKQRQVLLNAAAIDAENKKTQTEYALAIQEEQKTGIERENKTDLFVAATLPEFSNEMSSDISGAFNNLDLNKPENLEAIFEKLDSYRESIPNRVATLGKQAQQAGAVLSPSEIEAYRQEAENVVDAWQDIAADERLVRTLSQLPSRMVTQEIIRGLSNPETRGSALNVLLKVGSGESFSDEDVSFSIKTLSTAALGRIEVPNNNEDVAKVVETVANSVSTVGEEITPEQQEDNYNRTLALLDTSKRDEEKIVAGGALPALVKSIAESNGDSYRPEDKQEIGELLYEKSAKYAASAIAAAINSEKSNVVVSTFRGDQVARAATLEDFTLDANTLELVPINKNNYRVVSSDAVIAYNNYVKDKLKALEDLGQDTKKFKEDISKSVLMQLDVNDE